MTTPNLFTYATSELSQDAFLCWLLAWGDKTYAESNPALHRVGTRFIRRLLEAGKVESPRGPLAVEVRRQFQNIDVLALVGADIVILIEDKTHTSNHSGQLARYKAIAEKEWPERVLVCIYLKTGDQTDYGQADFSQVKSAGYAVFTRRDLLDLLHAGVEAGVTSDIYRDFLRHLQVIEDSVQSFRTRPPSSWHQCDNAWKGLYPALKEELGEGGWHYVANPSGGFLGYYWCWHSTPDEDALLYLQLEETRFCVKIEVREEAKQSALRNVWSGKVLEAARRQGLSLRRPPRFGRGQWMTLAVWDEDYRQVGPDGLLDLKATVSWLRQMMALVEEVARGDGNREQKR